MAVKTFNDLRADMPIPTAGAISGADIINLVDTIEDATTQQVVDLAANYTTSAADNRRFFVISHATGATFTVPATVPVGWECAIMQNGAGQITVAVTGGTLRHPDSHTKTAKQYSMLFLKCIVNAGSAPTIGLSGDTAL